MITIFKTGDLFAQNVEALVNTVNCVGVMGKGIALEFKKRFPRMYTEYHRACQKKLVTTGTMHVVNLWHSSKQNKIARYLEYPKLIINFPTKQHWRDPSKYEWIQSGLIDLASWVDGLQIQSIAIPALGCSNGGLNWAVVLPMIEEVFAELPDVDVRVFAPQGNR